MEPTEYYYEDVYCHRCWNEVCPTCGCCQTPSCEMCSCHETEDEYSNPER